MNKPISAKCVSIPVGAFINSDGNVYPCCVAAPKSIYDLSYGNAFENGFMETWYSARAVKIRTAYKQKKGQFSMCAICPENRG